MVIIDCVISREKERADCTMNSVHEMDKPDKANEQSPSQCDAHSGKNSNLNEFLKYYDSSEKKTEITAKINNLDKAAANENPDIGGMWSANWVVVVTASLVVLGYAMQRFARIPSEPLCWTSVLKPGGIFVSALATAAAALIGWKCKRDLATIQLKLDALDIWEKVHPIEAKSNSENNVERREIYLLKRSYVNTILWGLSGVTILGAFATTLGSVI